VDVLVSIASAGTYGDGPTCTPTFKEAEQVAPWFDAKGLRHPTLGDTFAGGTSFVPNDVKLGGTNHSPFMLLTGPNMGGKSTLLRQVCLAVILAQVSSCQFSHSVYFETPQSFQCMYHFIFLQK
jgi:DNA mismatch repair protein MSH6